MKGAGGGLLIIVGLLALWLVLSGKIDAFVKAWKDATASMDGTIVKTTGGQGVGGGTDWGSNESLIDALKKLPNPPKIPASILNDPIFK